MEIRNMCSENFTYPLVQKEKKNNRNLSVHEARTWLFIIRPTMIPPKQGNDCILIFVDIFNCANGDFKCQFKIY